MCNGVLGQHLRLLKDGCEATRSISYVPPEMKHFGLYLNDWENHWMFCVILNVRGGGGKWRFLVFNPLDTRADQIKIHHLAAYAKTIDELVEFATHGVLDPEDSERNIVHVEVRKSYLQRNSSDYGIAAIWTSCDSSDQSGLGTDGWDLRSDLPGDFINWALRPTDAEKDMFFRHWDAIEAGNDDDSNFADGDVGNGFEDPGFADGDAGNSLGGQAYSEEDPLSHPIYQMCRDDSKSASRSRAQEWKNISRKEGARQKIAVDTYLRQSNGNSTGTLRDAMDQLSVIDM